MQKSTIACSFKVIALAVEQNDGSTGTEAVPFCKISDTKQQDVGDSTPPKDKFNSSPLKNDGWKTILSYWEGNFSGANC